MNEIKKMNEVHHGSERVEGGGLTGRTDTDHFYFLCPECGDVMQVCDYYVYNYEKEDMRQITEKYKKNMPIGQIYINLKLYCHKCKYFDYTKITNVGWLEGELYDR